MPRPSSRKVTSPKMASKAAKALSSSRTSKLTKSLAGTALAQASPRRRSH